MNFIWQYDWCSHPTQVHCLYKYLGILHKFVDFPVWWMLYYWMLYSMIICLHRTSLIMLSCHFRYFVVIILCIEKSNLLLCRLQWRCILNVLMYEVNHLYRWWIGVGRWHFLGESHRLRYDWQSVCDGMTQIGTCLSNSSWTTPKQRREHHNNVACSTKYCDLLWQMLQRGPEILQVWSGYFQVRP